MLSEPEGASTLCAILTTRFSGKKWMTLSDISAEFHARTGSRLATALGGQDPRRFVEDLPGVLVNNTGSEEEVTYRIPA